MVPDLLAVAPVYKDLATYGQGVRELPDVGHHRREEPGPLQTGCFPSGAIFGGDLARSRRSTPKRRAHLHEVLVTTPTTPGGKHTARRQAASASPSSPPWPPSREPASARPASTTGPARRATRPSRKDVPMEVGPLAQILVAYLAGQRGRQDSTSTRRSKPSARRVSPRCSVGARPSRGARHSRRTINADNALRLGRRAARQHQGAATRASTPSRRIPTAAKAKAGGTGLRGALCALAARSRAARSTRYAAVPASNWNFAPRDDKGVRGPVEEALIGTPVADPDQTARDPAHRPHLRSLNGVRGSRD